MRQFLYAVVVIGAIVFPGCKSSSSSSTPTPTSPTTPGAPTILTFTAAATMNMTVGDSRQLKAVALMSDGSTEILTSGVTWTPSDNAILSVDNAGVVTAIAVGTGSVVAASGGVSGTFQITVTAASAGTEEFIGTLAGPSGVSATADLFAAPTTHAYGTLYSGLASVTATGRFDTAASVLNVVAGGYTILGTVSGAVLAGTVTDPAGNLGAFSAIDATHVAVTTYCGTYTASDGTSGPFNLAAAAGGAAAASAAPLGAAGSASAFTGTLTGATLALTSAAGATATGTITSGVATGTVQGRGVAGSFTANSNACR